MTTRAARNQPIVVLLEQKYHQYCQKNKLEPLPVFFQDWKTNKTFHLELQFLPEAHFTIFLNCLRQISLENDKIYKRVDLEHIRVAWNNSNSSLQGTSSQIVKQTMDMLHQRVTQNRRSIIGKGVTKWLNPLDVTQLVELFKALCPLIGPHLQTLEFMNIKLSNHCTAMLGKAMYRCSQSLRALLLNGCEIGDVAFTELFKPILQCSNLTHLQLKGCNLTDESASFCLHVLKSNQQSKQIDMWKRSLRSSSSTVFDNDYTPQVYLSCLDLSNNFLTEKTAKQFATLLIEDTNVKSLNLENNVIGVDALLNFVELAKEEGIQVQYINLSFNHGVKQLKQQLKELPLGFRTTNFIHPLNELLYNRPANLTTEVNSIETKATVELYEKMAHHIRELQIWNEKHKEAKGAELESSREQIQKLLQQNTFYLEKMSKTSTKTKKSTTK